MRKKVYGMFFLIILFLLFSCTSTAPFVSDVTTSSDITIGEKLSYYGGKEVFVDEPGIGVADVEYRQARWKKAVWNMPFNGMTVALDTQTDRLLSCPSTLSLVKAQMMEVIGAANALGVEGLDESFADKMIRNTQVMVPYSPSMKLDYDFHRPMEIEFLYTRPIAEARAVGYEMPRLAMLESLLRYKEESPSA